jgi:hypothetical protein
VASEVKNVGKKVEIGKSLQSLHSLRGGHPAAKVGRVRRPLLARRRGVN